MTDHQHGPGQSVPTTKAPSTPAEWDEMYAEADQVWSGNPNIALVREASTLSPGTALDVGCGEGADAIWLAQQGWTVSGFDVSAVALGRAREHCAAAGVTVTLHHGGLLDVELPEAPFDLVNVHYPVLEKAGGRSLTALLGLVAPGGTLLFVHHGDMDPAEAKARGFDLADYLMPADVHRSLGEGWTVRAFEERGREVHTGRGAGHSVDVVLRAHKG